MVKGQNGGGKKAIMLDKKVWKSDNRQLRRCTSEQPKNSIYIKPLKKDMQKFRFPIRKSYNYMG